MTLEPSLSPARSIVGALILLVTACAATAPAVGGSRVSPSPMPAETPAATATPAATTVPVVPVGVAGAVGAGSVSSPALDPGAPRAGDRTLADIREIISAHRDTFRACYDQLLLRGPKGLEAPKGRFALRFVLNPDGSVKSADQAQETSDIHDSELVACEGRALGHLTFPASSRGMETKVTYPFTFQPQGAPAAAPAPSGHERSAPLR